MSAPPPMELEGEVRELQRQLAQVDLFTNAVGRRDKDTLELLLLKRGNLKFKMYQETGHKSPHIHIDYGRERRHTASYAIDTAERLVGTLNRKYERTVTEWISSPREKLLQLCEEVQAGGEASGLVVELAGDA